MDEGGVGQTFIVRPGAPCEDFEEGEIAGVVRGSIAERLDVGGLQQLGEDVCV